MAEWGNDAGSSWNSGGASNNDATADAGWGTDQPAAEEYGFDNANNNNEAGGFGGASDNGNNDNGGCFSCGQPGHMKSECPDKKPIVCRECGEEGHIRKECPQKPAEICRNCCEEGHIAADCTNPRKIDRSHVEDISAAQAWEEMKEAAADRDIFEFKQAMEKYLKHNPQMTYVELEGALRDSGMKIYIIAIEREISPTHTFMDLQGNLRKKYSVTIRTNPKPDRPRDVPNWPTSLEDNLARLADAGEPVESGIPRCKNCMEMGHISKNCTMERVENEKIGIHCHNCDGEGHRQRDCPNPRKNKFACKNCGQPGHKAAECTEPRNADGVECNKCHEMGHFSRDCPQGGGSRDCRNCGQEGHIAKDCPEPRKIICRNCDQEGHMSRDCSEPRRMQCRNCDEYGHTSRDCSKPLDVSKIKCNNCGEMGHKKMHCPNPTEGNIDDGFAQNDNFTADTNTGGDGGWETPMDTSTQKAAGDAAESSWDAPSSAAW